MKIALYPGAFDPFTNGHLDILTQALSVFDRVVVAIAVNPRKNPLFTVEDRLEMIRDSIPDMTRVEMTSSEELTVDLARRHHAVALIRGLRVGADFEMEYQMALMNRHLEKTIATVCFFPAEPYTYVSSSLIKEVARFGGDLSRFVSPPVARRLREIFHPVQDNRS